MTSASDPAERQVLICRPAFQDSQQLLHRYHSRSELVRQMLKLRWWDPDRPRVLDLVDDAFGISDGLRVMFFAPPTSDTTVWVLGVRKVNEEFTERTKAIFVGRSTIVLERRTAQPLENLNDIPLEIFKALFSADPKQQEMIRLYMECSDEVQQVVKSMFAILDDPDASAAEKKRANTTIADALFPKPTEGHGRYGIDLAQIEKETASKHPDETKRPQIGSRLDQMDTQEASFAERLRGLLKKRNITQEELAKRINCTQSAISKMLTRNCRPQKKTIFSLAAALEVAPTALWPDLEVAAILDTVANFQQEQELTEEQANAIDSAAKRPASKVKGRTVVGFGALNETRWKRWPPPDGPRSRLLYIPQLGIDVHFHGKPEDPNWRFSNQIMEHLIYEARQLAKQIRDST